MPFDDYERLSRKDRRIYDASDAVPRISLGDAAPARAAARQVEEALASNDQRAVGRAAQRLADALTTSLGVERVAVRVLAKRPSFSDAELYGLGEPPRPPRRSEQAPSEAAPEAREQLDLFAAKS